MCIRTALLLCVATSCTLAAQQSTTTYQSSITGSATTDTRFSSLFHPGSELPFRRGHLVPNRAQVFFQNLIIGIGPQSQGKP